MEQNSSGNEMNRGERERGMEEMTEMTGMEESSAMRRKSTMSMIGGLGLGLFLARA